MTSGPHQLAAPACRPGILMAWPWQAAHSQPLGSPGRCSQKAQDPMLLPIPRPLQVAPSDRQTPPAALPPTGLPIRPMQPLLRAPAGSMEQTQHLCPGAREHLQSPRIQGYPQKERLPPRGGPGRATLASAGKEGEGAGFRAWG